MQVSTLPELYDERFLHPATHYVSGPSSSGKTTRICNLIRFRKILFVRGYQIRNIVVFYDSWQSEYEKLKNNIPSVKFINKKPTVDHFVEVTRPFKDKGGSIVLIDDMMSHLNEDIDHIFRVSSRHNLASVFLLVQSLFPPQKMARQISLNSRYFHLHRNPRESGQITHFARQILPTNISFVCEAFQKATKKPYGCLLVDLTQECEDKLRYRHNYLPSEGRTLVFVPR